jgi:hypothetical protein
MKTAMHLGLLVLALLAWSPLGWGPARLSAEDAKPVALFNGKDLKGWHVPDKFWFDNHGKVEVANRAIVLAAGKPGTGIVFDGMLPKEEYELTLEARRVAGDDFFCGLTFPVGESHCTLILGGWGGSVTGLSNVDDFAAVENETTDAFTFKQGQWYTIRLRVTKNRIIAWVDKVKIVDLPRKDHRFGVWWEQEPMRPLGIATWNTRGELRKIQLKRL